MSASPGFPYFRSVDPVPAAPRVGSRVIAILAAAYGKRECFICGLHGWCTHRERDLELAIARSSYGIGGRIG